MLIRLTTFSRWSQNEWPGTYWNVGAAEGVERASSPRYDVRNAVIFPRPDADNASADTEEPSGARMVSVPSRGSNTDASAAILALRAWHMKNVFCTQFGATGSNPESPCANA